MFRSLLIGAVTLLLAAPTYAQGLCADSADGTVAKAGKDVSCFFFDGVMYSRSPGVFGLEVESMISDGGIPPEKIEGGVPAALPSSVLHTYIGRMAGTETLGILELLITDISDIPHGSLVVFTGPLGLSGAQGVTVRFAGANMPLRNRSGAFVTYSDLRSLDLHIMVRGAAEWRLVH